MQAFEFIEDYRLVTDVFGSWPSFHDAEVHRMVLDRKNNGRIELLLHGWAMTSEITSSGHYKLEHQSLIHLLFEQVSEVQLDGLNHQNVLDGIELKLLGDQNPTVLAVELCHCYGLSGGFKASYAKVLSVVPHSGT